MTFLPPSPTQVTKKNRRSVEILYYENIFNDILLLNVNRSNAIVNNGFVITLTMLLATLLIRLIITHHFSSLCK